MIVSVCIYIFLFISRFIELFYYFVLQRKRFVWCFVGQMYLKSLFLNVFSIKRFFSGSFVCKASYKSFAFGAVQYYRFKTWSFALFKMLQRAFFNCLRSIENLRIFWAFPRVTYSQLSIRFQLIIRWCFLLIV